MKLALIMLVAIAAVAIGASIGDRRRRDSGADIDVVGSDAKSSGQDAAAASGVEETKDGTITVGQASATYGKAGSTSVIRSAKVRKTGDDDKKVREQRRF